MKSRFTIGYLLPWAAFVLVSSSGQAQRIGTRLGHEATQADALVITTRLANCIADRRPALVRKWFDTLPGSKAEGDVVSAETEDLSICLDDNQIIMDGKSIRFSAANMRYPVAIAALRKILPKSPTEPPVPKHSSPWFAAAFAAADKTKVDVNAVGLQDFGHCVATTDWPNTRAFLISAPESVDQASAIKNLVTLLGPCLPAGVTIRLNPANLRKVMAEPVYHILSNAPEPRMGIEQQKDRH